jgi:hypothetical protein
MTAKILQFKDAGGGLPHHRPSDFRLHVSDAQLFEHSQEDILEQWRESALRNALDTLFHRALPTTIRKRRVCAYLKDITYLAQIEQQLGMCVMVFAPEATINNKHGWVAAFKHDKYSFNTPEMLCEGYARGLNILCYLAFTAERARTP